MMRQGSAIRPVVICPYDWFFAIHGASKGIKGIMRVPLSALQPLTRDVTDLKNFASWVKVSSITYSHILLYWAQILQPLYPDLVIWDQPQWLRLIWVGFFLHPSGVTLQMNGTPIFFSALRMLRSSIFFTLYTSTSLHHQVRHLCNPQ